jgi:hypothetical protein
MFGLFKKKEAVVDALLERIRGCESAVPAEVRMVSDPLFETLAKTVSGQWKKEHLENYRRELQSGSSHEAFIYNFVVHASANNLESGNYHVYRGVLSFKGTLYKQLFEHAINTMIAKGEYTKEWADENLREPTYKGIKGVG